MSHKRKVISYDTEATTPGWWGDVLSLRTAYLNTHKMAKKPGHKVLSEPVRAFDDNRLRKAVNHDKQMNLNQLD